MTDFNPMGLPPRHCTRPEEHVPHVWPGATGWAYCDGPGLQEAADRRGHRARPATSLLGQDLIEALVAEGTCPADTRRVVIDASVDSMTVMYVETEATRGLLDVLRATSRAAVRVHQERPADLPAEEPNTEQKGTEDR